MNATTEISTKNAKRHHFERPYHPNNATLKGDHLNLASCWGLLAVCKVGKKFEMVVQKSEYARELDCLVYVCVWCMCKCCVCVCVCVLGVCVGCMCSVYVKPLFSSQLCCKAGEELRIAFREEKQHIESVPSSSSSMDSI